MLGNQVNLYQTCWSFVSDMVVSRRGRDVDVVGASMAMPLSKNCSRLHFSSTIASVLVGYRIQCDMVRQTSGVGVQSEVRGGCEVQIAARHPSLNCIVAYMDRAHHDMRDGQ